MKIKRYEGFTNKENVKSFNLMKNIGFIRDEELEKEINSNKPDLINMVAYKLEK